MKKFIVIIAIITLSLFTTAFASTDVQKIKILVIEINPTLQMQNMKASKFIRNGIDSQDVVINELVEDIEYSSHGLVDCQVVKWEYLDEFPTYKNEFQLDNGNWSKRFDEQTWINLMSPSWYDFWEKDAVKSIPDYSFDYEYFIEKFDLIERRNNGEFDQVWMLTVDPSKAFETMMVGRTAYWVNGTPYYADCDNFIIFNPSISRRDASFECIGHMSECILRAVFTESFDSYQPSTLKIKDINSLNLWERFILNNYASPGYYGVGNVHFAPNGTFDYDWMNTNYVQSTWIDWKENYPNLTGKTVKTNYTTWVPAGKEDDACRCHHRWWFSLMPHIDGRTDDGFLHNWWEYIIGLDYVDSVAVRNNNYIKLKVGDSIKKLEYILDYQSGKKSIINACTEKNNIHISNDDVLEKVGNTFVAKSAGSVKIALYYDGKYDTYNISVEPNYNIIASEWAINEINIAIDKNLMPKVLEGTDLTESITREDFASVAVKFYEALINEKVANTGYNPFVDTENDDVLKAYKIGITKGTGVDTFDPYDYLSREEMVTMLTRAYFIANSDQKLVISSGNKKFVDNNTISDWALESVYFSYQNGIINGVEDNKFAPKSIATKEQSLAITLRYLQQFE